MSLNRKGATRRCCYGVCKSDSRSKSFTSNLYYFIRFPKPCLQYRKGLIKTTKKIHIKHCSNCSQCELWVKKCGRSDGRFQSLDDITKDTYICSLHFEGESGPTEKHPDPIDIHKKNLVIQNKKLRTSLCEKYKETHEEQLNVSNEMPQLKNPEPIQSFIEINDDSYPMKKNISSSDLIQEMIPCETVLDEKDDSEIILNPTTCNEEIQTDLITFKSKKTQVNWPETSPMENFQQSIKKNKKECVFYTGLDFEQITILHNFLSPACENLNFWGNKKKSDIESNSNNHRKSSKLSSLQQLILVLLRLRMGYLVEDLAFRYNISTGMVSKIFNTWILFLNEQFTVLLKPHMFPSRAITDRQIFINSKIADLLQPGDLLGDRGFTVYDIVESKQACLNIPPFLNGRDRLSPQEEMETKRIAKQRIYIEHVIGRIKQFRLLKKKLPLNMRVIMSQVVFVCACLVNFQQPIVID